MYDYSKHWKNYRFYMIQANAAMYICMYQKMQELQYMYMYKVYCQQVSHITWTIWNKKYIIAHDDIIHLITCESTCLGVCPYTQLTQTNDLYVCTHGGRVNRQAGMNTQGSTCKIQPRNRTHSHVLYIYIQWMYSDSWIFYSETSDHLWACRPTVAE